MWDLLPADPLEATDVEINVCDKCNQPKDNDLSCDVCTCTEETNTRKDWASKCPECRGVFYTDTDWDKHIDTNKCERFFDEDAYLPLDI